jgi:hypothetical protein
MTAVEPVAKRGSRLLLTVTEAAGMLGIGRTLAYQRLTATRRAAVSTGCR